MARHTSSHSNSRSASTVKKPSAGKRSSARSRGSKASAVEIIGCLALFILFLVLASVVSKSMKLRTAASEETFSEESVVSKIISAVTTPEIIMPEEGEAQESETQPEATPEPTPETVEYEFNPHAVESTEPSNLIDRVRIMVNGTELEDVSTYENTYGEISFGDGSEYAQIDGVVTFRGNNYRNDPTWGTTQTLTSKKITYGWEITTASLQDYWGNTWTGNGWTGQSLVARWPKETRAIMTSMYDWAREQDDLVEVITASMDGRVYFTELSTGKATRKSLNMGITYKGGGALDPRGYPILYLGGGVKNQNGTSNISIVSLIDLSVMYSFASYDSFGARDWPCFDSSPLVDAETDQLIYPAENGLLYIVHLNTEYDEAAGTLSVNPDNTVKWRYHNIRNDESQTAPPFFGGIESSAAVYEGYAFLAENGGALMCLDLNTLELVWVQDVLDDTNCTPVIDIEEDGHPYIYISTSFHQGWRSYNTATVPIWKIDAETGEIIWQVDYTCQTEKGVSGGVEGTLAVDETSIYVPVAKADSALGGILVSIDKKTGEKNWEYKTNIYSWASPVRFDDAAGNKYILYNNGYGGAGTLYLLDAETGTCLDSYNLNGVAEASGVLFENWYIIPTRSCRIFGLKLT